MEDLMVSPSPLTNRLFRWSLWILAGLITYVVAIPFLLGMLRAASGLDLMPAYERLQQTINWIVFG